MGKYSPSDLLRKHVLRECIRSLVESSDTAVWFNLTFWENVTVKKYASKCWDKLAKALRRENPEFRLVGVWARQRRGAWHIHAVCNQEFDITWLRNKAMQAGFGPQFHVQRIDKNPASPEKIARYISGYITDKNGLDPVKDKGVRRTIFVGEGVKVVDMRHKSSLKTITSRGRELAKEMSKTEWESWNEFERQICTPDQKKRSWETWGQWYKRNREYWFRLGWESLDDAEREILELDGLIQRYFETGRWSYI